MERMTARCTVSFSSLPSRPSSSLFISWDGISPSLRVILYPSPRKKKARSAIFSLLGKSCTLYIDTPSLFIPLFTPLIFFGEITSATFLFAKSINSSINLFESPRSFLITFSGVPSESNTNCTSSWSSDIAPWANLSLVNFLAKLFKITSSLWKGAFAFFIEFSAPS